MSMIRMHNQIQRALGDHQLQHNLSTTLDKVLAARQQAVSEVEEWEELREYARRVKLHTLSRLDVYLEQLERRVESRGGKVVWADTGKDASDFIVNLCRSQGIEKVIKSKTMLGEEIGLNRSLETAGIRAVETDLGEYIVQLRGEPPSHIVAPALHLSRAQVSELFRQHLGSRSEADAQSLTAAARKALRKEFLEARLGITGVNFGIAESGTVVIVENEGNARLCTSLPDIHVAVMGIEKLLPRAADLAVFLKLLTRSATGQKITSYINFISGSRREEEPDGPRQFYLVLIDNGRSRMLADPTLRQTLSCIRCGACLNVCPVYRKIGGHAYHSTYQGPIGAILTPQLQGTGKAPQHPFASSLCGACRDVCPVKIEIPEILLHLRSAIRRKSGILDPKKLLFQLWCRSMTSARNYRTSMKWLRRLWRIFTRKGRPRIPLPPFRQWCRTRNLPPLPERSFREIYQLDRDHS